MQQNNASLVKNLTTRIILISSIVLLCILPTHCMADGCISARVVKIIDGDTIRVRCGSESILVRLWGIDTPEHRQPYSKLAKRFTVQHVSNAFVRLQEKDWDKYGRMVAIVTKSDGSNLNEALLKAGWAWVHIYYCKEAICKKWRKYEKNARQKRIGLWQEKSPVPPWVFKHKKKYRRKKK